MKMKGFHLFLLLIHSINIPRGESRFDSLWVDSPAALPKIFKEVDGVEKPVSGKLEEIAGTNLTLICMTNYWGNLHWGWERGKVQFKNLKDLKAMAQNDYNKILQFGDDHYSRYLLDYDGRKAVKKFSPLFPQDSGLYFCRNPRGIEAFTVVELNVIVKTDPENLNNYLQALNKSLTDFNFSRNRTRTNLPKFLCTNKMFTCNSGETCIDYKYVCDGKNDCKDGSDETTYLCGSTRCSGKERCDSGRCCCEKDIDLKCLEDVKTSCCFKDDFEGGYDTRDFSIPYNFRGRLNPIKFLTSSAGYYKMEDSISGGAVIAIVLCIIIIVIMVMGIIFRRRLLNAISKFRTRNLPPNNPLASAVQSVPPSTVPSTSNITPDASADTRLFLNDNQNQFKPPSYDEVVACTQPSAPIFEKCIA